MKNVNQTSDVAYFDTEKGVWYVVMPSIYSDSAYMVKRLSRDGQQHSVSTGTGPEMLAFIASLKHGAVLI